MHIVRHWFVADTGLSSWNKSSAAERGLEMGGEFRRKGVNIALGPVVCCPSLFNTVITNRLRSAP